MEENKSNKGLIWLIVLLIVLVLGIVGYIIYDKVILDNNSINNNKENITSSKSTTTTKQVNESIKIIGTNNFEIANNKIEIDFVYKNSIDYTIYATLKINNNKIGEYIVEDYSTISDQYENELGDEEKVNNIKNNVNIEAIKDEENLYYVVNYTTNTEGCCSNNHLLIYNDEYKKIYEVDMQRNPSYWNFDDTTLNNKFMKNDEKTTYFIENNEILLYENENDVIENEKKEITIYKLSVKNKGIAKTIYGNYSINY